MVVTKPEEEDDENVDIEEEEDGDKRDSSGRRKPAYSPGKPSKWDDLYF